MLTMCFNSTGSAAARQPALVGPALLLLSLLTACGRKPAIEAELSQLKTSMGELRQQLTAVQQQSAQLGNLGEYAEPSQIHFDRLKQRLDLARQQGSNLQRAKVVEQQKLEQLRVQLADYRRKYLDQ